LARAIEPTTLLAPMARYEFIKGSSRKFWEIELEGNSFTTTFGRIGSAGQSAREKWPSAEVAKREHDRLVHEKVAKGYVAVGAPAEPSGWLRAQDAARASPELIAHVRRLFAADTKSRLHRQMRGERIKHEIGDDDDTDAGGYLADLNPLLETPPRRRSRPRRFALPSRFTRSFMPRSSRAGRGQRRSSCSGAVTSWRGRRCARPIFERRI
jgi:predicted DNA-binding WGR domain protein